MGLHHVIDTNKINCCLTTIFETRWEKFYDQARNKNRSKSGSKQVVFRPCKTYEETVRKYRGEANGFVYYLLCGLEMAKIFC